MPGVAEYVRRLAVEIGPRPATTDAEADAADYIQGIMDGYGLEVERQEFESPRSAGGGLALGYFLVVLAAAAAWLPILVWPAVIVAALGAWGALGSAEGRGFVRLMPKGPSQNIIGRHVPRHRRGERLTKVVIVAHYDTAKSSPGFSPTFVRNRLLIVRIVAVCTGLVPLFLLLYALPIPWIPEKWLWYAALAAGAVTALGMLVTLYREFVLRPVPGGNDNASGVASLLGCIEAIVPAAEGDLTGATQPMRAVQVRQEAWTDGAESDDVVDVTPRQSRRADERYEGGGGVLDYAPAAVPEKDIAELPEDFKWAEPTQQQPQSQSVLDFDTVEFATVSDQTTSPSEERPSEREPEPQSGYPPKEDTSGRRPRQFDDSWADLDEEDASSRRSPRSDGTGVDADARGTSRESRPSRGDEAAPSRRREPEPKRGLWSRVRGKKENHERPSDWLGVDDSFDARKEGRQIGSWDNFDEDEGDGFGYKGGWAGDDPIGDPDFARTEAGRIRKRITESVDRALAEKEVWFVATGAKEPGGFGIRALVDDYGDDLRGALFINLQAVGVGNLHWISEEGVLRRRHSDRRLASTARRASSELELSAKSRVFREVPTDASYAIAQGMRAMSIMAFDINGRVANLHWADDTADSVQESNIENAVLLVAEMVRNL